MFLPPSREKIEYFGVCLKSSACRELHLTPYRQTSTIEYFFKNGVGLKMRKIKTLYEKTYGKKYLVGFGSPYGDYQKSKINIFGEKVYISDLEKMAKSISDSEYKKNHKKSIQKHFGSPDDASKVTYNKKMVKSGKHLEYYVFEKDITKGQLNQKSGVSTPGEFEKIVSVEQQREASRRRTLKKFTRLVNANEECFEKFITLTFNPEIFANADNVEDSNKYFSNFIKRLKRMCIDLYGSKFELKYITAIEFQKNGRVHYHMLSNMKFIEDRYDHLDEYEKGYILNRFGVDNKGFLSACWGAGYVDIAKVDFKSSNNCGKYLSKYMCKTYADSDLFGKKLYFASRNLEKPIEYIGDEAEEMYLDNMEHIVSINEIKTPYITFKKITMEIGKIPHKVSEKIISDDFLNITDFLYEYDTGLFTNIIDGLSYEYKDLFIKGFISEETFEKYAGIIYNYKKGQLEFGFNEN